MPSLDVKYSRFRTGAGATLLVAWVHRSRFGLELRAIARTRSGGDVA